MQRRRALVITSSIGFASGGAFAGAAGDLMLPGFALLGALGGWSIAWASGRPVSRFLLGGALGFFTGFTLAFFAIATLAEPPLPLVAVGLAGGALGGFALGLAWGTTRAMKLLALAGAAGFGVGMLVPEAAKLLRVYQADNPLGQALYGALFLGLAAAIGGAAIGWAASKLPRAPTSSPAP